MALASVGADLNTSASNEYTWSPLAVACNARDLDLVRFLLDHGAKWTSTCEWMEDHGPGRANTILHQTAGEWPADHLVSILELGADELIDICGNSAESPLGYHAAFDRVEHVKALLRFGANPNVILPEQGAFAPLDSAIMELQVDIVEVLLGAGANPNVPTWMWVTATDRVVNPEVEPSDATDRAKAQAIQKMVITAAKHHPPPVYPDGTVPEHWPPEKGRHAKRIKPPTARDPS
ncbi:MAG: hypothetical protein AAF747_10595 [Planctomycetota bacterium]